MEDKKAKALFQNMSAVEKMEELALRNSRLLLQVCLALRLEDPIMNL